jgi:hypothetical protein
VAATYIDFNGTASRLAGMVRGTSTKARLIYNMVVAFQGVINKTAYDALVDNLG